MMGDAKNKSEDSKPCPTCGAVVMHETRPFCSKRCADIDLGRWFQGAYAIPAVDAADDSIIDAERTGGPRLAGGLCPFTIRASCLGHHEVHMGWKPGPETQKLTVQIF